MFFLKTKEKYRKGKMKSPTKEMLSPTFQTVCLKEEGESPKEKRKFL